jgi:hypothetical protein
VNKSNWPGNQASEQEKEKYRKYSRQRYAIRRMKAGLAYQSYVDKTQAKELSAEDSEVAQDINSRRA